MVRGAEWEENAFVGVCQKVPSLSLTLDGLGLKITIDFRGAGEKKKLARGHLTCEGLFLSFFSLILSFLSCLHSSEKVTRPADGKEGAGTRRRKTLLASQSYTPYPSSCFPLFLARCWTVWQCWMPRPSSWRWKRPTCQHNSRPFSSFFFRFLCPSSSKKRHLHVVKAS